jgi:hypothetical protein
MSGSEKGQNASFATRVLTRLPEIREKALSSSEFEAWLRPYKTVVIDGTKFYIVGGDMLRDLDEMILSWARKLGLVDQRTIDEFHRSEEGT